MRVVLQRVSSANVTVEGRQTGCIDRGILALVGVGRDDDRSDVSYVADKIRDLRLFNDSSGRMNRSLLDVGGAVLLVSQFTLYGDCRKGRRPSFEEAAGPTEARALYEELIAILRSNGLTVQTGEFREMMRVELVNDGPMTLFLDSRPAKKS